MKAIALAALAASGAAACAAPTRAGSAVATAPAVPAAPASTHAADLPGARFLTHGRDPVLAVFGDSDESAAAIARAVEQQGFYAGDPVGAGDCAGCHRDVAAQWAASAHRFSSFNNPYYRVSVEEFRKERGGALAASFCGSCHEPTLIATGAFERPGPVDRRLPAAQAGVTCRICHSITHVDREGNGRYVADLRTVALQRGPHGDRLRPPLLGEARFCSTCHKVGLTPDITASAHWQRGQNDFDAWHVSGVSGNGAPSIFRPEMALAAGAPAAAAVKRCQDCHMPLEPAPLGDPAAKNGLVRSHRFLGANAALPHLRGDPDQEARTAAFLRGRASLALVWSGAGRVDALMRARGVGHRFPAGTMDSNEVWLEVTALDAAGRAIAASGARGADGALAPDTHLVRVQPVDEAGKPLRRRDPQHTRGVAFDAALTPSDPQLVRFEVPPQTARVRARLLYRKFSADYAAAACAELAGDVRRRCLDIPAVEIAAADVAAGAPVPDDFALLVDWGIALAQATADHVSEARAPLERARALQPARVEPVLGLARLALALGQTDEVVHLADEAHALALDHPAPMALAAQALLAAYRGQAALAPAEKLVQRLPNDRIALGLLARARGLTGDAAGALAAADRLLEIDPESEDGHYQRALALGELGRADEATRALALYDRYRATVETDLALRNLWRSEHADGADESEPCHTHRLVPIGGGGT